MPLYHFTETNVQGVQNTRTLAHASVCVCVCVCVCVFVCPDTWSWMARALQCSAAGHSHTHTHTHTHTYTHTHTSTHTHAHTHTLTLSLSHTHTYVRTGARDPDQSVTQGQRKSVRQNHRTTRHPGVAYICATCVYLNTHEYVFIICVYTYTYTIYMCVSKHHSLVGFERGTRLREQKRIRLSKR